MVSSCAKIKVRTAEFVERTNSCFDCENGKPPVVVLWMVLDIGGVVVFFNALDKNGNRWPFQHDNKSSVVNLLPSSVIGEVWYNITALMLTRLPFAIPSGIALFIVIL